jgi:hypothetical protein
VFGYEIFSDLDPEAELRRVGNAPRKFKIGVGLVLLEHSSIIALAAALFLAFGAINIALAIVWTTTRTVEGLIQIYVKKDYSQLLNSARQFTGTNVAGRSELLDSCLRILRRKNSTFTFSQILFSIGTLAYSILFISYEAVPSPIGWFGIVASTIYGFGNGARLVKPDHKALWNVGGLLIWIFETVLGGWLLFSPLITS